MSVRNGPAPPAAFMIDDQQVLVQNAEVAGNNVHVWTTSDFTAGPT
ncbi:hypothetical protein OG389_32615 [Streptomyces sp. NBC_00435]